MELRDKFAELALIHALKNNGNPHDVAAFAYEVADAMMAARSAEISTVQEDEEVPAQKQEPMPEVPTFESPEKNEVECPITNSKEMIAFLISKYKEIGQERGALIQPIISKYGYTNANEIAEKDFANIYDELNAL